MRAIATILLSLMFLAAATAHGEPLSREQAVQALASQDAQERRDAAVKLGDLGTMDDVPLLVRALRDPDADTRERAEQSLWRVWSRSGDRDIDKLYQAGVEQMNAGDAKQAIATFTQIIERKPDFAEGWNKRATLHYLTGDFRRSLADCDQVMKRNPYHFGALSGYVLIYVRLEYYERALDYARRALAINPNLQGMRDTIQLIEHALAQRRGETI